MNTNTAINDEKTAAESAGDALVQLAYDTTPAKHHHHIVVLTQNKRIGGKGSNVWASVKAPYMTVAGRVAMMREDHAAAGARVDIDSEPTMIGDRHVLKCTVTSSIHGRSVEYSEIRFGGSGVDQTSPIENAATSGLGRCLGAFGYGIFSAGLASADEVEAAIAQSESSLPVANPVENIPQSNETRSPSMMSESEPDFAAERKALCTRLNEIATDRGLTETLERQRELMRTQHTQISNDDIIALIEKFETMDVQHVESVSKTGKFHEVVVLANGKLSCSCTGFSYRMKCQHIESLVVSA